MATSSFNGEHAGRTPFRAGVRKTARPAAIVAGGAGFVGSHLCERLLEDGYKVYCVDNFHTGRAENVEPFAVDPRFVLVDHDIRDPLPLLSDATEIYNLACPASPPHYQRAPLFTATTSVNGTLNLLETACALKCRFLFASTSEVYGDPEEHPQRESYRGRVNSVGPRACYDEGKRMAEALCYDFVREHELDVRVARIFNTYGERMRLDDGRVVSTLVTQALRGEPLTVYGDGSQTRSFCYVSDLVEGLVRLMRLDRRPDGPVNLGNPEEYSISALAEIVAELTGRPRDVVYRDLPEDDPQRRRPDISRARALLGWAPAVPVRAGLERTVEWFGGELSAPARRGSAAPGRERIVASPSA